jgi:anaerobic ribonucleoside-triphosphate reductase activating protein
MSPDTWAFDGGNALDVDVLLSELSGFFDGTPPLDGLTISGGEPFDQPEALLRLLRGIGELGIQDILVFSGYRAETLLARYPEIPVLITALVDGPFEAGNETESGWKGSANQTMRLFRPEFEERYSRWAETQKGGLQMATNPRGIFIAGIPRQKDVAQILEKVASTILSGGEIPGRRRQRGFRGAAEPQGANELCPLEPE